MQSSAERASVGSPATSLPPAQTNPPAVWRARHRVWIQWPLSLRQLVVLREGPCDRRCEPRCCVSQEGWHGFPRGSQWAPPRTSASAGGLELGVSTLSVFERRGVNTSGSIRSAPRPPCDTRHVCANRHSSHSKRAVCHGPMGCVSSSSNQRASDGSSKGESNQQRTTSLDGGAPKMSKPLQELYEKCFGGGTAQSAHASTG
jgi:hypothetical protein